MQLRERKPKVEPLDKVKGGKIAKAKKATKVTKVTKGSAKSEALKAASVDASAAPATSLDLLPSITLLNQDSEPVNVLELAKKAHLLVIFVYPRANTSGCTRQAKGFRDEYEELKKLGATVVGLSADSPKAQTKFKEKQSLQYDLLCDPNRELIGALGSKKKGNGTTRSDFIVVDGVVKEARVGVKPEQSYEGVLQKLQDA
ncbi:DEKNAAC104208 [Brettanomyces naardenensis]|uniref:thioredoxin-dependent peroxiredoxin n=1 Tax=Brettanomyces naardenensis TaxID=13370 RepID=A0A448YQK6_BRENA|nr:DEKNAAC104208 [Brettanomyces naardenensis]